MKNVTQQELDAIITRHELWLEGNPEGKQAKFVGMDLSGLIFSGRNLSYAVFIRANLSWVNLRWANLYEANLCEADLCGADLCGANLCKVDLRGANLCEAILCGADLTEADLCGAHLRKTNLNGTNLCGANIDFSALPLWCGSLQAHFDEKQLRQIAYHLVRAGLQSVNIGEDVKAELAKLIDFANGFHRVNECGKIYKSR